jgi:hypothetical protein
MKILILLVVVSIASFALGRLSKKTTVINGNKIRLHGYYSCYSDGANGEPIPMQRSFEDGDSCWYQFSRIVSIRFMCTEESEAGDE